MRHKNDVTSVMAWVEEMSTLDYNPVLAFKMQGISLPNAPTDDFLLVVQTSFQCDMLKSFGSNAVCIDSTHGTNAYDFNLTSILVIDDYGEGLPVGWMISNREDKHMLVQFFTALKQRGGYIKPQWFMTDDAEQYYNAWKEVFEEGSTRKVLCAWHVDRAWRRALHQHINEREKQVQIYHQLRVLLTETEVSHFRVLLQGFLTYIEKHHYDLFIYFSTHYCKRVEQWASCYRQHTAVNTNMFVEAFHRVLKMVYLHHKRNRRVDVLLVTLLRISRDKAFERFHKMETGKQTHRMCEINRRHKAAELMQLSNNCQVTTVSDIEWRVQSQSQQHIQYQIKQQNDHCECRVTCSSCGVCPHNFTCTCLDSLLHSTVCKHIHFLVLTEKRITYTRSAQQTTNDKFHLHMQNKGTKTKDSEIAALKNNIHTLSSELQLLTEECTDKNVLRTLKERLQASISLAKVLTGETKGQASLIPKTRHAPNSNHDKQLTFYSTRKRKQHTTNTISKPSLVQISEQRKKLKEEEPIFCGVCFQENDKSSSDTILWVQCATCAMWIHNTCIDIATMTESSDDYTCHYCLLTSTKQDK